MQIDSLRYFIGLAEAGSFYRAAERLFISKQGVSRAVSALEAELGAKLVERTRRGVELTEAGELLLERARSIVAEHDALVEDLLDLEYGAACGGEPVRLTCTAYLTQVQLALMKGMAPLKEAAVMEDAFDRIMERVAASDGRELFLIDLFPDTMAKIAAERAFCFEPLFSTRVGILWGEGFELAGCDAIRHEELAHVPIAYNCDSSLRGMVRRLFADAPLENVLMTSTSGSMLVDVVASGRGVSLFDSFAYYLSRQSPAVSPLKLGFTPLSNPNSLNTVGFIYPRAAKPSPRCRRCMREIQLAFGRVCAGYLRQHPTAPVPEGLGE